MFSLKRNRGTDMPDIVHMPIHTHTHTYKHTHTYRHAYIHTYIQTRIHTHTHTVRIRMYGIWYMCIKMRAVTDTHTHTNAHTHRCVRMYPTESRVNLCSI